MFKSFYKICMKHSVKHIMEQISYRRLCDKKTGGIYPAGSCLTIFFRRLNQLQRLSCDSQLLVGGNHHNSHLAVCLGNYHLFAALHELLLVQGHTQIAKVFAAACANTAAVLADPCGEGDDIYALPGCHLSTDILCYAVAISIQCHLCDLISLFRCIAKVTEVTGKTIGKAQNTGLLVQYRIHLVSV